MPMSFQTLWRHEAFPNFSSHKPAMFVYLVVYIYQIYVCCETWSDDLRKPLDTDLEALQLVIVKDQVNMEFCECDYYP